MPSSEFKRLFQKDKNLSFNLFLMQVSNEDALKVRWFSHTCEKPKSSKTFLTTFSHSHTRVIKLFPVRSSYFAGRRLLAIFYFLYLVLILALP